MMGDLRNRRWRVRGPKRIVMKTDIHLVDRGRGLQLSTSRITVQDLVPYFQEGCSNEEIIRWIPTLTAEEIAVVERYYREHQAELDEEDRLIGDRTAERVRQQRLRFPEFEGTLADVNTQGPVEDLIREMQGAKWVEFWTYLGLVLFHFEDVGLRQDATD